MLAYSSAAHVNNDLASEHCFMEVVKLPLVLNESRCDIAYVVILTVENLT